MSTNLYLSDPAADLRIAAQIDDILIALRSKGRHAIRILDLGCGAGGWLFRAVLRARMLGFAAIEGRGIDDEPRALDRAQETAAHIHDPRIGLSFDLGETQGALAEEEDHGADIILIHQPDVDSADLSRVSAGAVIAVEAMR